MVGVGVEVMALILILSVFNGLEDFQKGIFKTYDPDIKIVQSDASRIQIAPEKLARLRQIPGVRFVHPVLEDQALIRYGNKQMVVKFKGVDSTFLAADRLKKQVVEGGYFLQEGDQSFGLVGIGVFLSMGMSFENTIDPIEAWYPDHRSLKNFSIREESIRTNMFFPSGVIEVEQNFNDQMVLVPLNWMDDLVGAAGKLSAYELMLNPEANERKVQTQLKEFLGPTYQVQTRDEQHAILLKAIKIEKLFVFLIIAFVMGIASFTLFYALSLLVIDKRKELKTLFAMGFNEKQLFQLFMWVGFIISFSGACLGMLMGFGLAWGQQTFGWVSLGIENAVIDAYPIQMQAMDFVWTALVVMIITTLASIIPARKAVEMTFRTKQVD